MSEFRLVLPDGRGILGSTDESGMLSFVIVAGKGSAIRGSEMFDLMMRSFGSSVRGIAGTWRRGFEEQPSTNIQAMLYAHTHPISVHGIAGTSQPNPHIRIATIWVSRIATNNGAAGNGGRKNQRSVRVMNSSRWPPATSCRNITVCN